MEYFENELFEDNWRLTASITEGIFQNEHCYEAKIPIYQLLKDCRRNVVMWFVCFFQALLPIMTQGYVPRKSQTLILTW